MATAAHPGRAPCQGLGNEAPFHPGAGAAADFQASHAGSRSAHQGLCNEAPFRPGGRRSCALPGFPRWQQVPAVATSARQGLSEAHGTTDPEPTASSLRNKHQDLHAAWGYFLCLLVCRTNYNMRLIILFTSRWKSGHLARRPGDTTLAAPCKGRSHYQRHLILVRHLGRSHAWH